MKLEHQGTTPHKAHAIDAAFDLKSAVKLTLYPGQRAKVPTGLKLNIPAGYAGLVLPRSGAAINNGLSVLNAPGLIDPGYTGEVCVILINHDPEKPIYIEAGDRIAQIMFVRTEDVTWLNGVQEDWVSDRGEGGFGSSG